MRARKGKRVRFELRRARRSCYFILIDRALRPNVHPVCSELLSRSGQRIYIVN